MRTASFMWAMALFAIAASGGCSTTARYVTAEHWSSDDTFYLGYTEYTEKNYVVVKQGHSSAHVVKCQADAHNGVACEPQLEVDRLLNPGEEYPEAPPSSPPAEPEASEPEPATEEPADEPAGEGELPNA